MITNESVQRFLAGHRIAVAGASDRRDSFGRTVCQALEDHGYEPLPVHPRLTEVAGWPCAPTVSAIPGRVDGVIVMVSGDAAVTVVEDAAGAGVDQVWLFRGLGGPGALSDATLAACERHGITPVAGACPLMFLEPVGAVHRLHRSVRRHRGALEAAGR